MTDSAALTSQLHTMVPILGAMGVELIEAEPGRAACRLPAEPNVNHFGVSYAGSLFSAAEMLGGVISLTSFPLDGFVPIVKRVSIDFLRPASTAVVASVSLDDAEIERIRTEALDRGKAEFDLRSELVDEEGTVVAATTGTYQLRRF
ncbi:PaaI family thioesterase [Nocardioides limicola]|uniref:PaaI family thioesterase n=1 Tax=Nocardioides limicola TaxID=2803368 RepID=UPI00193BF39C|nr:YiiD C-terminal domain-containing protein [Nocardioides sp. DJM-14]